MAKKAKKSKKATLTTMTFQLPVTLKKKLLLVAARKNLYVRDVIISSLSKI